MNVSSVQLGNMRSKRVLGWIWRVRLCRFSRFTRTGISHSRFTCLFQYDARCERQNTLGFSCLQKRLVFVNRAFRFLSYCSVHVFLRVAVVLCSTGSPVDDDCIFGTVLHGSDKLGSDTCDFVRFYSTG